MVLYLFNHFGGEKLIAELARSSKKGWDAVEDIIGRLKADGVIGVNAAHLHRVAILRYFSAALLINNPYAADYALLQIDRHYIPGSQKFIQLRASERAGLQCESSTFQGRSMELCL